jgi:predicted permease
VVTANLALRSSQYPGVAEQTALLDQIDERVAAIPGVQHVGFTRFVPLHNDEWSWSVTIEGAPEPEDGVKLDYGLHPVYGEVFQALGMHLLEGRFLNETDRADGLLTAVVNEEFVERFFPDGRALGRRFRFSDAADWIEIVGVVQGTRHYDLSREPEPAFFLPQPQNPYDWFFFETYLAVKVAGDPVAAVPAIRNAVREVDSEIPVTEVTTLEEYVSRSVARTKLAMTLLSAFAAVALVLATVGIYGVISHTVGQRVREIGIRIALGAEPSGIVRSFVTSGVSTALLGIVAGAIGAAGVARLQASLLYGADPVEPGIYAAVAVLFAVVAALASYLPARRAGRLDATEILREE